MRLHLPKSVGKKTRPNLYCATTYKGYRSAAASCKTAPGLNSNVELETAQTFHGPDRPWNFLFSTNYVLILCARYNGPQHQLRDLRGHMHKLSKLLGGC